MQKLITLDSGLTVALDHMSELRSTSFGIFTKCGSANEPLDKNGISHFIEHLNFKGTASKSARDIAVAFDEMGGQSNAFTTKELTCFYAKTLDTNLSRGFSLLSDMFLHSSYNNNDIKSEKKVVYEEISMVMDTPDDLVVDNLCSAVWKGNPLGNRIIGNKSCISKFNSGILKSYVDEKISTKNTIITVAGSFNEDEIVAQIKEEFACLSTKDINTNIDVPVYKKCNVFKAKDIEQSHITLGFNGIDGSRDKEYYALSVLNTAFGNGMSSRLFQKIREEMGFVYSVYSFPVRHNNAGLFLIYFATNPRNKDTAVKLIQKEIEILLREGLSNDELVRSKEQLKSSLIMGLESSSSRIMSMGKSVAMSGRLKSQDELICAVNDVTLEDISNVSNEIFDMQNMSISVVG